MSNRLLEQAKTIKRKGGKLFCAYITLGFPSVSVTEKLIQGLDKAGVDILELGFPFSDPLADGPTIQRASQIALRRSISIETALGVVRRARKSGVTMPIVFFSYINPILQYGFSRFARDIRRAGFDGVIVPDLPPDEDPVFLRTLKKSRLAFINLIAPTSGKKRAAFLSKSSEGFIYYVSRRGVTGERRAFEEGLKNRLRGLCRNARKPVLVGFGVSSPEQAREAAGFSDGVVVGSALITAIGRANGKTQPVIHLAERFARAVHPARVR